MILVGKESSLSSLTTTLYAASMASKAASTSNIPPENVILPFCFKEDEISELSVFNPSPFLLIAVILPEIIVILSFPFKALFVAVTYKFSFCIFKSLVV